jgi:membrane protein YdbS with pleckstrin-like domain
MLPSFLLCILLTLLLAVTAVLLALQFDIPPWAVRYGAYALAGALWLLQALRWAYRHLVCTYRLTTRRLFLERTFFRTPGVAIELRHITKVAVERTAWDRWVGVGRVRITSSNGTWVLDGVRQPGHLAATIQLLVDQQAGK